MSARILAYIGGILLILALAGGIFTLFMKKSEGYKASGNQYFQTNEFRPLIGFGCMHIPKQVDKK